MKRRAALAAMALAGVSLPRMPLVRAQTAPVAPGAPDAGSTKVARPAWVPAPGMRADISTNLLADVDPCPRRDCVYSGGIGQRAVITAWSGAAFATQYGRLGAWVTSAGGHGDYYGNETYAFELDTRRWVRLNEPYRGGRESDVDYEEGEYAPGVPLSSHSYQHAQYLPPALGGGTKGSLLMLVKYAAGRLARGSGRTHACDLQTGAWSRYSANLARIGINATSSTAFDEKRGGYWRVPYGGRTLEFLDCSDRKWRAEQVGPGPNAFGRDHVCALDPERDLLVVLNWTEDGGSVWSLGLADRKGWQRVTDDKARIPASTRGMSIEWCPPLDCFVCYEGRQAPHVRKLHPPARKSGDGWRWELETLDGAPPAGRTRGPMANYSRFRFAPSIGCFIWADGSRMPVQAWRLRGT